MLSNYHYSWYAEWQHFTGIKLGIFVAPLCGSEENKIFLTSQQVHSDSGTVWRPLYIHNLSQVLKLVLLLLQNHVKELIWLALWNLHSSQESVHAHRHTLKRKTLLKIVLLQKIKLYERWRHGRHLSYSQKDSEASDVNPERNEHKTWFYGTALKEIFITAS